MRKSPGRAYTQEEALERIQNKCKEKDYQFIGFANEDNKYVNQETKLILKCNKCGNVWNTTSFDKFTIQNRGCPNCSKTKPLSEKEAKTRVLERCKETGLKFVGFKDGSYINAQGKLILRCKKCGREWDTTTYTNFLKRDRSPHSCKRNSPRHMPSNINEDKAIKIIQSRLEGTNLKFVGFVGGSYIGSKKSYVLLKCSICGKTNEYSYRVIKLKNWSRLCKSCQFRGKFSHEKALKMVEDKCKLLDYTFLGFETPDGRYNGSKAPISYLRLRCNKCGREWNTTTFSSFTKSVIKCTGCTNSWKMEKEIEVLLKRNGIDYIKECRKRELPWLTNKISLRIDYYLPKYKIAIECQGRQHFEPVHDFGGEKVFQESIERDKVKLSLCKEHGVKMLYYDSENGHKTFLDEPVYNTEEEILKEIIKH